LQEGRLKLTELSWDSLATASFAYNPAGGLPRPIANASFALTVFSQGSVNPLGFKVTNLALHLANGLLLFAWLRLLLVATGRTAERSVLAAGGIALLWTIHPLQVSTVFYVVQRMEMMWVSFALISLLSYTRARIAQVAGRSSGLAMLVLSLAGFLLGFGAKESAALIPFLLLALERIVFRCEAADPRWACFWRRASNAGIVIGAAAIAALFARVALNPSSYAARDFTLAGRLLAQAEIVPMYLGLTLLPRVEKMSFYYDDFTVPASIEAGVFAGVALLTVLLVLAWRLRQKRPLFSLGVSFFLIGHLLTSGPLPLELVFEHRNYLPIAGVLLALYGLLPAGVAKTPQRHVLAAIAIAALGLGALTAVRAAAWGSPVVLAQSLVDMNPGSTRAAMDLGEQYMLAANKDPDSIWYSKAVAEFERASRLPQGSIMGEHALILMNADFGLPADPSWWDRLREKLLVGPLRPQDQEALLGLVDHYLNGITLDGRQLSQVTLMVSRQQLLAPDLLASFAQAAYQAEGSEGAAVELFARALVHPQIDEDYRARIRAGIAKIGDAPLLARVDAFDVPERSPDESDSSQ
jgi:hypothetical protein